MRGRSIVLMMAASSVVACRVLSNDPEPPPQVPIDSDAGDASGFDSSLYGDSSDAGPILDASPESGPPSCTGPCPVGHACKVDSDCEHACGYNGLCVEAPSCKNHLGGDTCGLGEVGQPGAMHESCCRSLEVKGFSDPTRPNKRVYLDKYEITAGRVRAWIAAMTKLQGGSPNIKLWIQQHKPSAWDQSWDRYLPTDFEGGSEIIPRRLLGDPRVEDGTMSLGPGMILPPDTDQPRRMGVNYQFNSEVYVDLHGGNCGAYAGSYGFSTYYYPPNILSRDGQLPRPSGLDYAGKVIPPQDLLDVKSMNCITNAMLQAFCTWDGGQLATTEVLDYVTDTPSGLGNVSGCGAQYDSHGELLGNVFTNTLQTGGRCADVIDVNATFDAGDNLPLPGSSLNQHNYHYPDIGQVTHDKSWEVASPGRGNLFLGIQKDLVVISPGDEPWSDLNGNLNEAALETSGGTFTGRFALKYRGIGYGSSRSDLNMTLMRGESVLRIQRPEAKAAYIGGRCMRFR